MPVDSSSQSSDAHRERWQDLTNRRPIPPRQMQDRSRQLVPVLVRCVWSIDGEVWCPGVAQDWVGRDVHVRVADDRMGPVSSSWVDAGDVRRRAPSEPPLGVIGSLARSRTLGLCGGATPINTQQHAATMRAPGEPPPDLRQERKYRSEG